MILPDANILVYAVNRDSPFHMKAKAWLEDAVNGSDTVGLTWIVILGFLRLTTREKVLSRPLKTEQAFEEVACWLEQPNVRIAEPTGRHLVQLRQLMASTGTGGNLTSDAHLAAIAMEHEAVVYTADADFARFLGVRWRNPLV